jgi:hypothetical protein
MKKSCSGGKSFLPKLLEKEEAGEQQMEQPKTAWL